MPTIPDLLRLLEREPNDAFVLYGLAQEYAKAKDTAKAVEYYDRCLAADPTYVYAYYHKARAMQAAGRVTDAADVVRAGITASRAAGDHHAVAELSSLQDEFED